MHARVFSPALLSAFTLGLYALTAPVSAQAGEHEATLHISALQGEVSAKLARYDGSKVIDPKLAGLEPAPDQGTRLLERLGIGPGDFREESSRPIRSSDPWVQTVAMGTGGTFILNLADWTGRPYVKVELKVDGVTVWEAEGSAESFQQWIVKTQSPQVKTTDDRKLLVMLE